jgi:hypothetical protein
MNASFRRFRLLLLSACALLWTSCRSPEDLLYKPKADDRLDGYQGSLAEAGVNTEMDWGPKQEQLLGEFKTLREEHVRLQRRLDEVQAENLNLKTQLDNEGNSLDREKRVRAQFEAEGDKLRLERRELQARILSLSIEKAKLEQMTLHNKIAELQRSLEDATPTGHVEAAAPAPGGSK